MSLRRDYSPSLHYPDSSVKDLNLDNWNKLLKTLSIGEDTELELRGTPTHKLLERLHPILTNQDRGVSLEYDLQNHEELYLKCNTLINEYREKVGRQSSVYLARTVRLGNQTGTIKLDNPDAVYLRDFVADFKAQMAVVRARAYIPVSTKTDELTDAIITVCNNIETKLLDAIAKFTVYPSPKDVNDWKALFVDKYIGSDLMQAVYADFSKAIENKVAVDPIDKVQSVVDKCLAYITYPIESYSELNEPGTSIKIVTVRLYPTYSGIAYVCPQPVTTQLSHSRFIQSKTPAQNIRVTLQNNIALNTLDTQWYGFYTELFSNIIEYGNPAFILRAGHDRIEKCYLTEPLTFAKRNDDPMQTFTLGIISSNTGINVSDSRS